MTQLVKTQNSKPNEIVLTLYSQIEKGVLMALGAREFVYSDLSLQFKANRRDKVIITYDKTYDLYNIALWTGNLLNLKRIQEIDGVSVEQLNNVLLSLDR